tara:strand:+ start:328 stop:621 length:294 start_codon:yes stop_codon:yes gene_type:complete
MAEEIDEHEVARRMEHAIEAIEELFEVEFGREMTTADTAYHFLAWAVQIMAASSQDAGEMYMHFHTNLDDLLTEHGLMPTANEFNDLMSERGAATVH